jgi:hypothetical protein
MCREMLPSDDIVFEWKEMLVRPCYGPSGVYCLPGPLHVIWLQITNDHAWSVCAKADPTPLARGDAATHEQAKARCEEACRMIARHRKEDGFGL